MQGWGPAESSDSGKGAGAGWAGMRGSEPRFPGAREGNPSYPGAPRAVPKTESPHSLSWP